MIYQQILDRHKQLEDQLADQSVMADMKKYAQLAREYNQLEDVVTLVRSIDQIKKELCDLEEMMVQETDKDMAELAIKESQDLKDRLELLEKDLQIQLLPKDPNSGKDVIFEIRAGTGGDEASLFASDLFRMYSRFSEKHGWKVEIMSVHATELKGFKEIIFSISGTDAYDYLKYEMGGHRVQRIPATETNGRIHTSAVTVAVLPEVEEADVDIDPNDLRIDVFRSSGPGGQSVNTTDSAVRVTHIPSGLVVSCQDEKSQHKNKAKAMRVLRARLQEARLKEQHDSIAHQRKSQIGSGDRSQRIRTYNFSENRITDHRITLTLFKLGEILEGELDYFIEPLKIAEQNEQIKELMNA